MTIDSLKSLALEAEINERFDEALNLYRLAMAHAEETKEFRVVPPLLVRAGEMLVRLNDMDQAARLFEQAGHVYAAHGMIDEVKAIEARLHRAVPDHNAVDGWVRTMIEGGYGELAPILRPDLAQPVTPAADSSPPLESPPHPTFAPPRELMDTPGPPSGLIPDPERPDAGSSTAAGTIRWRRRPHNQMTGWIKAALWSMAVLVTVLAVIRLV